MKLKWPRTERTPKQKAAIGFAIGAVGIAVGIITMIPFNEDFGTAWTMVFAIITGIYYTRLNQFKKKK